MKRIVIVCKFEGIGRDQQTTGKCSLVFLVWSYSNKTKVSGILCMSQHDC